MAIVALNDMKPFLFILLVAALFGGCKRESFNEAVNKDLSERTISTNTPQLGTDPNVREDLKRGKEEVTSGALPGGTSTPRSADTLGGGGATGAGGAGPGYDGSTTNQPK